MIGNNCMSAFLQCLIVRFYRGSQWGSRFAGFNVSRGVIDHAFGIEGFNSQIPVSFFKQKRLKYTSKSRAVRDSLLMSERTHDATERINGSLESFYQKIFPLNIAPVEQWLVHLPFKEVISVQIRSGVPS